MKKFSFILSAFFVMFFVLPSRADVDIVTLPYTFNAENSHGYIDMNNDGIRDFYIYYESSDSYGIQDAFAPTSPNPPLGIPSSGNRILAVLEAAPLAPAQATPPPLTVSGTYFTTLLTRGTSIESTPPSGSSWRYDAYFCDGAFLERALGNNFSEGLYSGYVGVYYMVSGNTYYGWLNVEIDEDGEWVKINSSGHASAPATPVPAGLNDPFSVPVPLVATLIGFSLIGGGVLFRRKRNKK